MNAEVLLAEDELRLIARGSKSASVVSDKYGHRPISTSSSSVLSIRQLETTLQAVIRTAGSLQLSESHAAAACDALRASLSQCEDSKDTRLRALAYSQRTWNDVFDVFLTTSENRKPKPLKLLLVALERNLAKNPSQSVRDDLIAYVSLRTWRVICMCGDQTAVKPALQALRHFMSKSVIRAQDIVSTLAQGRPSVEDGETYFHGAASASASLNPLSTSQYIGHSHDFFCKTLYWLRHPDTAPITGRLIATYCRSLRVWSSSLVESAVPTDTIHSDKPLWWSILKSSLKRQLDLLDLFASHVFPEIVHQDREGLTELARQLSLQYHRIGSVMALELEDLRIYLMIFRAIKEINICETIGTAHGPRATIKACIQS